MSNLAAKQLIVRLIEEIAYYLPNNNDINAILQFHGNELSPAFVGLKDFSNEQLRTLSCSDGPFEWVNCVFEPKQVIAALVSSSPRKRNVVLVRCGVTDSGRAMIAYFERESESIVAGKTGHVVVFVKGKYSFFLASHVCCTRRRSIAGEKFAVSVG